MVLPLMDTLEYGNDSITTGGVRGRKANCAAAPHRACAPKKEAIRIRRRSGMGIESGVKQLKIVEKLVSDRLNKYNISTGAIAISSLFSNGSSPLTNRYNLCCGGVAD